MKPIAPALIVSVLITCAVAGLASIDGGAENATAGDAQPVGTFCDTPSDPCWPGNLTPTPQVPEGGMDAMAIDMDPSNAPANTATSIGSREFCARINENDVLDADEDSVDTLQFDVTTGPQGIPASNPMTGFLFDLRYAPDELTVVHVDVEFLLASGAGSVVSNIGESGPDSDGVVEVNATDINGVVRETGAGVLARASLGSNGHAGAGIYHLVLESAAHTNATTATRPDELHHGVVAIGTACPSEPPPPSVPPTATTPPTPTTIPIPTDETGMDAMSIDMDPSNSPVNTATSVGTREFCARINENDVLDADEDAADTLEFDVTTGANGIPEGNPMLAFTFDLRYNSYGVAVVGNDVEMLLKAKAGSAIFDLSQSLPDTDGEFTSTGADFGSGPLENVRFESGPGVLARMRIESRPDVISGIHHLILSNAVHVNTLNSAYAPLVLNHAVVAIGTECPETQPEPTFPPGPTFTPGATTPAKTSPQTPFTPPPKESPIKPTNTPTPTPPGTPTPPQPTAPGPAGDSVTDTPTPAGLPSAGGEPRHARSEAVLSALALAIIGFAAAACWTALRAPKK